MKFSKWTIVFLFIAGICVLVALFHWKAPTEGPVTLRLVGATNNSAGTQFAYFCLSNSSPREIVYLSDGSTLPYYHLSEEWEIGGGIDRDGRRVRHIWSTNHNLWRFSKVRPAILAHSSSVIFPVEVPAGVTGATLRILYTLKHSSLERLVRDVATKLRGRPSGSYETIDIKQPFDRYLEPLDKDLVQFNLSRLRPTSSNSTDSGASSDSSETESNLSLDAITYVPLAVLMLPKPVERVRALLTDAGITVVIGKPATGRFPPDSYLLSVPETRKREAVSLIRKDAPVGNYWIQVQP